MIFLGPEDTHEASGGGHKPGGRALGEGCPQGLLAPQDSSSPNSSSINTQIFPLHQGHTKNTFPPPQASILMIFNLGVFSGTPSEGDSIMEGIYINLAALAMKRE